MAVEFDVTSLHHRRATHRWERTSVGDLLERMTWSFPDQEALVGREGAYADPAFARLTYRQADQLANQIAHALLARGLDRGGLYGWTWGGCGYIDLLWVREDQRGSGLGSRLLAAAEEEIRVRGCDQVALSTHSFQAPGFYARLGYRECGRIPEYPRGHDQIQLVKRLS